MHKQVFMYGCLTITISLGAISDLPVHENIGRSELSAIVFDRQQNAAQPFDGQEGRSMIHNKNANADGGASNITVFIHDNGPIEARFSLSDNQTKYVTGLAALMLICCTVVATQNAELIMRLLEQRQ